MSRKGYYTASDQADTPPSPCSASRAARKCSSADFFKKCGRSKMAWLSFISRMSVSATKRLKKLRIAIGSLPSKIRSVATVYNLPMWSFTLPPSMPVRLEDSAVSGNTCNPGQHREDDWCCATRAGKDASFPFYAYAPRHAPWIGMSVYALHSLRVVIA